MQVTQELFLLEIPRLLDIHVLRQLSDMLKNIKHDIDAYIFPNAIHLDTMISRLIDAMYISHVPKGKATPD